MDTLTGLRVVRQPLLRPKTAYAMGDTLFVGPKPLSRDVWEAMHKGRMLDWYEYIGEGPGSMVDVLFGYGDGALR